MVGIISCANPSETRSYPCISWTYNLSIEDDSFLCFLFFFSSFLVISTNSLFLLFVSEVCHWLLHKSDQVFLDRIGSNLRSNLLSADNQAIKATWMSFINKTVVELSTLHQVMTSRMPISATWIAVNPQMMRYGQHWIWAECRFKLNLI